MRFAVALVLALVIGMSAMIQEAFAAEKETPQTAGAAINAQDHGAADPGSAPGPMTPSFQWPIVEHDGGRN